MNTMELRDLLTLIGMAIAGLASYFATRGEARAAKEGVSELKRHVQDATSAALTLAKEAFDLGKSAHARIDKVEQQAETDRIESARADERTKVYRELLDEMRRGRNE